MVDPFVILIIVFGGIVVAWLHARRAQVHFPINVKCRECGENLADLGIDFCAYDTSECPIKDDR